MSVSNGLILVAVVIVAIVGFVALGYALALSPLYAGFLLLWYWATVDKLDFKAAPATIAGTIGGAATAWALQLATQAESTTGIVVILALIVVALFMQVMNYLPFLFNSAFMLFLTVACAPLIQGGERFEQVAAVILLSAVYFGALIWVGTHFLSGAAGTSPAREAPIAG
jgi:hypothetical protein